MGRSLIARWPIVPASEVPDDLVDQAMAVLQGKSREAVIRELQRTVHVYTQVHACTCTCSDVIHVLNIQLYVYVYCNFINLYTCTCNVICAPWLLHVWQSLDVNQAVNNLLSREDDDGDDEGETGIIRLGFPPGG